MTGHLSCPWYARGRQWTERWLLLILVLLLAAGCRAPAARQAGAPPTGAARPALPAPSATALPANATAAPAARATGARPAARASAAQANTATARPATAEPAATRATGKPAAPLPAGLVLATPRPGARMPAVGYTQLPPEAHKTLSLIARGGPFPYRQDGVVFQNHEGLLPRQREGYYHEYTVVTPGSPDRGARRIISGGPGEYYYTGDHYASFQRVVP